MSNFDHVLEEDSKLLVLEIETKVKPPPMYQVVMHNDDFTPMDFVVLVLESFFNMDQEKATAVMYQVHMQGKAICGVYSRDVAETKAEQVMDYARKHEHPLMCSIEEITP